MGCGSFRCYGLNRVDYTLKFDVYGFKWMWRILPSLKITAVFPLTPKSQDFMLLLCNYSIYQSSEIFSKEYSKSLKVNGKTQ